MRRLTFVVLLLLVVVLVAGSGCRMLANLNSPGSTGSPHVHDPAHWDSGCYANFWFWNLFTGGIGYLVDIFTGNAPWSGD